MDIYSSIAQRKSCRNYTMQALDQSTLEEIEQAIQGFKPLYPEISLDHRFAHKVKGRFKIDAPHYLIVSGQGKAGEQESTGFLFQQLVLWLDAHEIGSVWLGSSKDADAQDTERDIIVLAFGRSPESIHRDKDQFKREAIGTISNTPEDPRIQAVHLAPSGMNTQPWYLSNQGEQTFVYEKKLKPPVSLLYKHSDIDMGIALCHYALACEKEGTEFHFVRENKLPEKAGYKPFGIIG